MRNIPSLLLSISVTRDRSFRSPPKIGHDLAKQPVTIDRNHRSRLSEMTGHDAPKYAVMGAFIQFISGVLDHWLFLISNVLLIEPLMSNHFPKYNAWAEKSITGATRAKIAYFVSVLGIFIASFLAWNDEFKEIEILKPKAELADERIKTIEAQKLTINDLQTKSQNPVAVTVKMLTPTTYVDRHLTTEQKIKLTDVLRPIAKSIPTIAMYSEGTGEEVRFLNDFIEVFKSVGINPIGPALAYADTSTGKGVQIGIQDENHPSESSIKFRNALHAANVNAQFTNCPAGLLLGADFSLFIY